MGKQNINIVSFNLLYEILDEIKENLFFDITNYENNLDFINNYNEYKQNSLIIIKSNKSFFLNKNISEKNLLELTQFPLYVNKLIELINVQLIKLKFNQQSKININFYELNLNSKNLSKNNVNLKLTEKEIEIILFLNIKNKIHNILDLQKNIWHYSPNLETHTVETHIYRLRKKISNSFNDQKFILSHPDGYYIK